MAEEDTERQQKAARAKEKLKRFQAQKTAKAASPTPPASSPTLKPAQIEEDPLITPPSTSQAPSATSTPQPSAVGRRDSDAATTEHSTDEPDSVVPTSSHPTHDSETSSSQHSSSDPGTVSSGVLVSPIPSSPKRLPRASDLELVQTLQQTVSLLVSDKNLLATRVRELEGVLEERDSRQDELEEARRIITQKSTQLDEAGKVIGGLKEEVKSSLERCKTLERDADLATHSTTDLKTLLEQKESALSEATAQLAELHSSTALSDLEAKLRAKTDHASTLELELSKARAGKTRLNAEKDALEVQLLESKASMEAAQDEVARITQSHTNAVEELEKASHQLATSLEAQTMTAASLAQATEELHSLRSEHDALKESLDTAKVHLATAEEALVVSQKLVEAASARRDGLQTENDGLLASLEEVRGKVVSLSNQLAETSDKNATLQRTISKKDTELKSALERGETLDIQVKTLEDKFAEATISIDEKVALVASLQEEKATLMEESKALVSTLEMTRAELERHRKELDALKSDYSLAVSRADASESEHSLTKDLLHQTTTDHELALANHATSLAKVETLEKSWAEAETERTSLTTSLSALQTEVASHLASIEHLRQQHSAAEADHASTKDLFLAATTSHETALASHTDSLARVATLENALSDSQSKNASLSSTISSLETELAANVSSLEQLRKDHQTLTSTSNTQTQRIDELSKLLEAKTAEAALSVADVEKLRADLNGAKDDLAKSIAAHKIVEETLASTEADVGLARKEISSTKALLAKSESLAASLQETLDRADVDADVAAQNRVRIEEESAAHVLRVKEVEASLEVATATIATHLERVGELEKALEAKVAKAKEDTGAAQKELKKTRSDLTKAQENLKASEAAKKLLDTEATKLRSKVDSLEKQLKTATSELTAAKSFNITIEQALLTAKTDFQRLNLAHDTLSTANVSLNSSLEELRTNVATLNDTQSSQSEKAAALAASLEQKEAIAAASLAAREKLEAEMSALREQVAESQSSRKQLQLDLEESQKELRETMASLEGVVAELETSKQDLAELEANLVASRQEYSDVVDSKVESDSQVVDLKSSLESLTLEFTTVKLSRSELEEKVASLQRSIKEKEAVILDLEAGVAKEVEGANSLVRERDVALTAAVRRASKSERELKAIMASGSEQTDELEKLNQTIVELKHELTRLRVGAVSSSTEISNLSEELERNVSQVEVLRGELSDKSEELDEATRALTELREAFGRAQEDVSLRDAEIDELKSQPSPTREASPLILVNGGPEPSTAHPYDQEYVEAIQLQHELDLSAARAQIRSLEERIFAAEDTNHRILKANGDLKVQIESLTELLETERRRVQQKEREVEALRAAEHDRAPPTFAVPPPPRATRASAAPNLSLPPHSHPHVHTSPSRSSAVPLLSPILSASSPATSPRTPSPRVGHRRIASHLPSVTENLIPGEESGFPVASPSDLRQGIELYPIPVPPSLPRDLKPSTRHARRESLSLLKSRMEEELGVEDFSSKFTSPVIEDVRLPNRRQTDMVWCGKCSGDLYIV